MIKLLFTIILVSLTSASVFPQNNISADEYKIYSVVIDQIVRDKTNWVPTKSSIVISSKTYTRDDSSIGDFQEVEKVQELIRRDFKSKNKISNKSYKKESESLKS